MVDYRLLIMDDWANTIASFLPSHQSSIVLYQWGSIGLAGLIMFGLGTAFAIVLLVASERLKVPMDPRLTQVYEILPHLDCGACGYPGCSGYAKAVIANPELLGQCAPGGADAANKIAAALNLQISNSGPAQRPIVHCRAHTGDKTLYGRYQGIPSCTSANALANVQACKFGCLGFGDCVRACKFGALTVVEGLATVDYAKCTGCAACSKACPRNLIRMVPFGHENMMVVACSSRESGKNTRAFCQVGCIGCGLCVKQSDAFVVEDNLARLDYARYEPSGQNEAAYNKCPTGVIVYRGKSAPAPREPKAKQAPATNAT
ncbi:MAG: RnfABCDGE type electron transport complex subunit B [Phycisphaerae bacterium]|nr:RnfABCDGE type electron transport complex subunit B [Phycisphaerae bacterium]